MNHRPSSIKLWDKCPFSADKTYYRGKITKRRPYEGYATGSYFHELMRAYIDSIINDTPMEPDLTGFPLESIKEADKMFDRFTGDFTFNPDLVLTNEDPISHENITGIPDLTMYGDESKKSVIIIDWKSAWSEMGTEFDSLGYYAAIIAMNDKTIKEFILRVCMVRYNLYLPDVVLRRVDALDTWSVLSQKMKEIDKAVSGKGKLEVTPGTHCNYCEVIDSCPLTKRKRARGGHIKDVEEARQIACEVIATKAWLTTQQNKLKSFCATYGVLNLPNGIQYGFKPGSKWEYPDHSMLKSIMTDVEYKKVLKVDGTKLNSVIGDDEDMKLKLSRMRTERPSTNFGEIK